MSEGGFQDDEDVEEEAGGCHGLYWGTVLDNKDPARMGRVAVVVHGITTRVTDWAFPVGMPGSGFAKPDGGKGSFYVPRIGAVVLVGFIYGKMDEPFYMCGHYAMSAASGVPRIVQEQTVQDAPNVRVVAETETFEIYITDTTTEQKIVLQTLDKETTVEIDAKDGSITLKALNSVTISAPAVSINGLVTYIKGRPVSPLGLAI